MENILVVSEIYSRNEHRRLDICQNHVIFGNRVSIHFHSQFFFYKMDNNRSLFVFGMYTNNNDNDKLIYSWVLSFCIRKVGYDGYCIISESKI